MNGKKVFASVMMIVATLMWGLSYSMQNLMSSSSFGTFTIVFFKGIGSIIFLPLFLTGKRKLTKRSLKGGFLIGIVIFLGCLFQQIGIETSTVSKASFITSLYIIFVPLFSMFIGKKVGKKIWISVAVALAGLYFLCMHSDASINKGDLYLLAGSSMFAVQIILIDHYVADCDPIALTLVSQMVLSFFALTAALFLETIRVSAIFENILPIFFIVFISGAIAQLIQTRYQKDLEPSLASLLMSFESVSGALFGWIILSQTLNMREIFGCVLVFIAILTAES